MISLFDSSLFWLWTAICVVSLILEIVTFTALVSIWFTIGALFAIVATWFGFGFGVQVFIFFTTSILLFFLIRPLANKNLRGNIVHTNLDRIISTQTRLLKAITLDHMGEIKINGLIWNAVSVDSNPIDEKELVEILAIEGTKVIVKKI